MSAFTDRMCEKIKDKLSGSAIRNPITDGEYFGFEIVRKAKGRGNYDVVQVWVDCDPEGNGPGFLNISDGVTT